MMNNPAMQQAMANQLGAAPGAAVSDAQKQAFQQQMVLQMQAMAQQPGAAPAPAPAGENPFGGPGAPAPVNMPAGANATTAGANTVQQPVEFNPYTGMPMAPASQVLPQTVQPISGPAPTPVDPSKLQYQTYD